MQSNADVLRFGLLCLLPSLLAGALIGRTALRGTLAGGLTQVLMFAPFLYRDYPNIREPAAVVAVIVYGTIVGIIGYGIRRIIARIRHPKARSLDLALTDPDLILSHHPTRATAHEATEAQIDAARSAVLAVSAKTPNISTAEARGVYGPFERPNPKKAIGDAVAASIAAVSYVIFYGGLTATWLYGIWSDLKRGYGVWFVGDIAMPPIGVLRGILTWLGYL
jgi:hypothetical protein